MEGLWLIWRAETSQGWLCGVNYTPALRNRMVIIPSSPWEEQGETSTWRIYSFLRPWAKRKTRHWENMLLPQPRVRMQYRYHESQTWLSNFHPSSPISSLVLNKAPEDEAWSVPEDRTGLYLWVGHSLVAPFFHDGRCCEPEFICSWALRG